MKRIAVVGAGLAGLGVTWPLLESGFEVVLFDAKGIGGGASGISTGLLHPFPGKKALPSWRAEEGMEATAALLTIAQEALPVPVEGPKGIFRPAITAEQKSDFSRTAAADPRAVWKEIALPGMPKAEGLWIASGRTVYSLLYLQGLWRAAEKRGAALEKKQIESLAQLASFDAIVLCLGAQVFDFPETASLPVKATLGQTLLCRWEKPLPFSLVSQGHITPTEDRRFCQVGSTYEHTPLPDPTKAKELLEKVALFYPPATHFQIE